MQKFTPLLLDVWRDLCQRVQLDEALQWVAPRLAELVPLDLILVRRIDLKRSCLETVGAGMGRSIARPQETRSACTSEGLDKLLAWCGHGEITHQGSAALQETLTGIAPHDLVADVMAGPLIAPDGPMGVLVLAAQLPRRFTDDHLPLVSALLEPFTVALENDHRLHEMSRLREAAEADKQSLLTRLGRQDISDTIVGAESGLRPIMERVELVARTDAPVLIFGETGSGKEVIARAIHTRSRRAAGPFLRVNCGAIPSELIDSELFGHERGSFTGAVGTRHGWFERSDGGTLFLDEIGELPAAAQVRLLRILQDGTFERVGGARQLTVDVRIVGATHRDLHAMTTDGRFREDLWYRLAVFPFHLPPLRDRVEDIPALATHFALRASRRFGTAPLVPTPADMNLLIAYPWPGNVRELATVMDRAAILGDGKSLEVGKSLGAGGERKPAQAAPSMTAAPPERGRFVTLEEAMSQHIKAALTRTGGRIEGRDGAAALLDINPHTLRARMRKLGVDWRRYRARP